MPFSTYLKNKLIDHLTSTAAFTQPTLYVALSTANPGATGSGMAEPSGGGYSRKATGAFDSAASGASANTAEIAFDASTGAWAEGDPLTHFAVFDAATDGNLLFYGALDSSRTVDAEGITLRFAAGELDIEITDPA